MSSSFFWPEKNRIESILLIALPLIGGMFSQTVLNLIDTAMVSRLENSDAALAAVGYGGFILFTAQALILGLSTGVLACSARRKGENRIEETAYFLNAALLIIAAITPIIAFSVYVFSERFFPIINGDPQVIREGVPYLQARAIGIIFVCCNFAFRGFWNALNMTKIYLITMVSMHILNVILNYALIFGNLGAPQLGVEGAGLASTLSVFLGTVIYFSIAFRRARHLGFLRKLPQVAEIFTLLKLSLPNGLQQLFFSTGFLATFWIIGKIGTPEVAAANILVNLMLAAMLPSMALGLSAASLVGQALGKNNIEDASLWGWDVAKIAVFFLGALGIIFAVFPETIVSSLYFAETNTLQLTLWPMRLVGVFMSVEALGIVMQNALLGAGDTKRVMTISTINQWFIFLPLAYFAGPVLGLGLTAVWFLQSTYRIIQTIVFCYMWRQRKWARVHI